MPSLYLMPWHCNYRYFTLMLCDTSSFFRTTKMISISKGNIRTHYCQVLLSFLERYALLLIPSAKHVPYIWNGQKHHWWRRQALGLGLPSILTQQPWRTEEEMWSNLTQQQKSEEYNLCPELCCSEEESAGLTLKEHCQ